MSQADLALRAARGQTAMTFALTNGCNAIVDILDKHQAILDAEEAGHPLGKGVQLINTKVFQPCPC